MQPAKSESNLTAAPPSQNGCKWVQQKVYGLTSIYVNRNYCKDRNRIWMRQSDMKQRA